MASGIYDVFPLQRGSVSRYEYHYYSGFFDINYTNSVDDSGYYSYEIVDSSSTDDSTVSWEVLEHAEIIRHVIRIWWAWGSGEFVDTTFFIDTTASFVLTERMTGDHELVCSSRVWNFPMVSGVPVFRYADSPEVHVSYNGCLGASFVADSGYTYGYNNPLCGVYDWVSGWGTETATSRLIGKTVTDVANDLPFPSSFSLEQNYPNPFNPVTVIEFALPEREFVSLKIFNLLGQEVATLLEGEVAPGVHRISWDAAGYPSGVYLYRMRAGPLGLSRKLILMR